MRICLWFLWQFKYICFPTPYFSSNKRIASAQHLILHIILGMGTKQASLVQVQVLRPVFSKPASELSSRIIRIHEPRRSGFGGLPLKVLEAANLWCISSGLITKFGHYVRWGLDLGNQVMNPQTRWVLQSRCPSRKLVSGEISGSGSRIHNAIPGS